jgi:hypothetical protein
MFCHDCICHGCPYGLTCRECDTWLDGHILLIEGCNGQKECDECLFDYIAREETCTPEHAEMLRNIVRNKDSKAMDEFFDWRTGPYHNAIHVKYDNLWNNSEVKKHEDDRC